MKKSDTALPAPRLWPPRFLTVRLANDTVSCNLDLRSTAVTVICTLLALAVAIWAMTVGELKTSLADVWGALIGSPGSEGLSRVVIEWRMPRVLMALFAGGALAFAGGIFQSITKNPLGSPDIIGFNTGAYTGVIITSTFFAGGYLLTISGALIGGFATALLIYFLAFVRGTQGLRLVLIGIGFNAMLNALNTYLLMVIELQASRSIAIWGAGSLNLVTWTDLTPLMIVLGVSLAVAIAMGTRMRLLEMGDDNAASFGVHPEKTRILMIVIAVILTSAVTAVVGPISFLALAAPQIAKKLIGRDTISIFPAVAVGALLLSVADLIAKTIIAPAQLPTGVVTVVLGGAYLLWLIIRGMKKA